jgi:CheY-like chemotaxis protein
MQGLPDVVLVDWNMPQMSGIEPFTKEAVVEQLERIGFAAG